MEQYPEMFERTALLIGKAGLDKLQSARVAVIGLGGVGSYTVEALARAGVGYLRVVDNDLYAPSNLNRQLHALVDTIGMLKSEVVRERVQRINPEVKVDPRAEFVTAANLSSIITRDLDYVVDAIDTVSSKIWLIRYCLEQKIRIVSCMGTGNRLDPSGFCFSDISKTHTCPLARAVRSGLRKIGIDHGVEVLFSTIPPLQPRVDQEQRKGKENPGRSKQAPGSISFLPSIAGLLLAGLVVNRLLTTTVPDRGGPTPDSGIPGLSAAGIQGGVRFGN